MSWLLVVVGIGSEDFNDAADRLVLQAEKLKVFDKCVSLKDLDIHSLIPELRQRVFGIGGETTPGYGFYSWKSRVAKLALNGTFGSYKNIVMVDAGCEVFRSAPSLMLLHDYFGIAKSQGVFAFSISTPECLFTKKSLFEQFPTIDPNDSSEQFQSGVLFFSGVNGKEVAETWDFFVWKDEANVNDTLDVEREDFCKHRHDQSVLSLVLKQRGITPSKINPPGLPLGIRSYLACFVHPVWWARNRSGSSVIPSFMNLIGAVSFFLPSFFNRFFIRIFQNLHNR